MTISTGKKARTIWKLVGGAHLMKSTGSVDQPRTSKLIPIGRSEIACTEARVVNRE